MKKTLLKIGFWFLSLTWGVLMTLIGLIGLAFCWTFLKCKVHKNGFTAIVELGGNWGGVSLGAIAFCGGYTMNCPDPDYFQHVRRHEFGHSIQNVIWGPLFPFAIAIPSAIRCGYHKWRRKRNLPNATYDSIWFEGQATKWGTKAIDSIEDVEN